MRSMVELKCEQCTAIFNRDKSEHKRCESRGYRQFCSRVCGKLYMKEHGHEFVEHFKEWQNSDENKQLLEDYRIKHLLKADPFREFLRRARKSVNSKGRELNLTLEDLKEIWNKQKGKCPYTGWDLEMPRHRHKKKIYTASLDRIDSSQGYIKGNIQFVCVMANFAKCDFSMDEMNQFCDAIKENWDSDLI